MTMNKDDRPGCRSWPRLRAACVVVAVVIGLSQALTADNGPVSPVVTDAHVELHLTNVRHEVIAPRFLTSHWNGCLGCAGNSPLIDGAAIVTSEPFGSATRAFHAASPGVDLRVTDVRQEVSAPGFLTSLWNWLFAAAESCFGCAGNWPLIDGAAIVTSGPFAPATRGFQAGSGDVHQHVTDMRQEASAAGFRTSLWNWLFGAASSCVGCAGNSPLIDGAAIVTFEPLGSAKRVSAVFADGELHLTMRQNVTATGFLTSLWNWLVGAAGGCLGCAGNSPLIDGAAIVTSEPLGSATRSFHAPTAGGDLHVADVRREVSAPGFLASLWNWLFGAAENCAGCAANSPLIDGAAIVAFEPLRNR